MVFAQFKGSNLKIKDDIKGGSTTVSCINHVNIDTLLLRSKSARLVNKMFHKYFTRKFVKSAVLQFPTNNKVRKTIEILVFFSYFFLFLFPRIRKILIKACYESFLHFQFDRLFV